MFRPAPGTPRVDKFVSMTFETIRYSSRLPVAIYVPKGAEVKYRIWTSDLPAENFVTIVNRPAVLAHFVFGRFMNKKPEDSRKLQFGMRSFILVLLLAGPFIGLFAGTFGESSRANAVSLLGRSSTYLFPLSTIAAIGLILIWTFRLFRNRFGTG